MLLFLALVLLVLVVMAGMIFRYRTQRVLFHASASIPTGIHERSNPFYGRVDLTRASPRGQSCINAKLFPLYLGPIPGAGLICWSAATGSLDRIFHNTVLRNGAPTALEALGDRWRIAAARFGRY